MLVNSPAVLEARHRNRPAQRAVLGANEWASLFKKRLTEPALLEMSGNRGYRRHRVFAQRAIPHSLGAVASLTGIGRSLAASS